MFHPPLSSKRAVEDSTRAEIDCHPEHCCRANQLVWTHRDISRLGYAAIIAPSSTPRQLVPEEKSGAFAVRKSDISLA
jgi:hypothetical protein